MTGWFFKEALECSGSDAAFKIQQLLDKYKTDIVLLKRDILQSETYRIEVWYNLFSERHVLNVFIKGNSKYEDEKILDIDINEI